LLLAGFFFSRLLTSISCWMGIAWPATASAVAGMNNTVAADASAALLA
jgi:hypothetical protein